PDAPLWGRASCAQPVRYAPTAPPMILRSAPSSLSPRRIISPAAGPPVAPRPLHGPDISLTGREKEMVADEESTVRYEAIRMGWYVVVVEIGSKDGVASTRPVAHAPAVRDVDGSIRLLDYYRTSAWRREGGNDVADVVYLGEV